MKKTNLTTELILKKKFPTELSGYNATEVDKFLDEIIEDYQTLNDEIELLKEKVIDKNNIIDLKDEELEKMKIEIESLKVQLVESSKASNYEILKAIEGLKNK